MCRYARWCWKPVLAVAYLVVSTWRTHVHAGSIPSSPVHDDVSPRRRSGRRCRRSRVRAPASRLSAACAVGRVVSRTQRWRGPEPAACRRRRHPRSTQRTRTHAGRQCWMITLESLIELSSPVQGGHPPGKRGKSGNSMGAPLESGHPASWSRCWGTDGGLSLPKCRVMLKLLNSPN